jgi:hypothetical protein
MEHSSTTLLTPKRDVIVAFRLTCLEAAHIDAAAAILKKPRTRGDFCRAATLHAARQRVPEPAKPIRLPPRRLPALDTQLLSKLLAEVGKLGGDVNQMSRTVDDGRATATLATMAQDIATIRDAIIATLGGQVDEVTS